MARRLRCITVAVALAAGGLLAGAAPAGAAVTCGSTITTDTTLTTDLVCPGDGVVVGAPGITLDLGGHAIRGPGDGWTATEHGVMVASPGVTVRNGRIEGFRYGVSLEGGSGVATRLYLLDNGDGALVGSSANRVEGNLFVANSNSVLLQGGGNVVQGNSLRQNAAGVFLLGAGNDVLGNNIVGEGGDDSGILTFGYDARIVGNRVSNYRGTAGITVMGTAEVSGNHVYSNVDGIVVLGAATMSDNVAYLNVDDGIDVRPGGWARLGRNTATQNGDLGIEASGAVSDAGGNRASGNGDPRQCLGIACS